jgi:hypothetical protein
LVSGGMVPARAGELRMRLSHSAATFAAPAKNIRQGHLIKIACAQPLPNSARGFATSIPIVLGVGY